MRRDRSLLKTEREAEGGASDGASSPDENATADGGIATKRTACRRVATGGAKSWAS